MARSSAPRGGGLRRVPGPTTGTIVLATPRGGGVSIAPMRSRLRFIVAIGLAVVLGGGLAYSSLGGSLETYAGPGELAAQKTFRLNGKVAPGSPKDAAGRAQSSEGLTFTVVDKENPAQTVSVLYRGDVPDQFKDGREIVVTGTLENGTFVARPDSLVTLCPSKFTDRPDDSASG